MIILPLELEPTKIVNCSIGKCRFIELFFTPLVYKELPDGKRQQTTTVDYKRLINGLVLADGLSLHKKS